MKKEIDTKIDKILEDTPKDLKAVALVSLIEKLMRRNNLSWLELSKVMVNEDCILCGSKVRKCSCGAPISIGLRNNKCVNCGLSYEKLQIEPDRR